ncbi:MAG: glycerol-3-phosphate 1-O-acyltransferase PlsY [Fimbriimonadaceae bacterium]
MIALVALFIAAYLVGSVPVGYLYAKRKGIDITKVGSGNIGATNIGRHFGKGPAIAVFLMDLLKGVVPVVVARFLLVGTDFNQDYWLLLIGIAAVLGHTFSPWLGFKGGKGIATGLGMCFAAAPLLALIAFSVFGVFIALTRIVSLSSLVGTFTVAPMAWLLSATTELTYSTPMIVLLAVITAYVFYKHRDNIVRLARREEKPFKFARKPKVTEETGSARGS